MITNLTISDQIFLQLKIEGAISSEWLRIAGQVSAGDCERLVNCKILQEYQYLNILLNCKLQVAYRAFAKCLRIPNCTEKVVEQFLQYQDQVHGSIPIRVLVASPKFPFEKLTEYLFAEDPVVRWLAKERIEAGPMKQDEYDWNHAVMIKELKNEKHTV